MAQKLEDASRVSGIRKAFTLRYIFFRLRQPWDTSNETEETPTGASSQRPVKTDALANEKYVDQADFFELFFVIDLINTELSCLVWSLVVLNYCLLLFKLTFILYERYWCSHKLKTFSSLWFAYSNDAIAIVVGVYFSLTQMMS